VRYIDGIRSIPRLLPRGELDGRLTKPIDFQFLMSFWGIYPSSLGPLIPAILLTIAGAAEIGGSDLGLKIPVYLLLLGLGLIVHYSLSIFFTAFSFVVTRIEDIQWLDSGLRDLGAKPIDIYPKFIKYIFFTVLPIAFYANVPVWVFRNNFNSLWVVYTFAFAGFALWASRQFFYHCLRRYNSASS